MTLVTIALYANSVGGGFHYDDFHSIVNNPHIRAWENIPLFFSEPSFFSGDPDKAMYRPILLTTYALNYAWDGSGASGFHVLNIALHVGCVLVVWTLARQLSPAQEWGPVIAGLLFAVHPLCTEPVNYISSRSELLAAFFYLLAFRLFMSGRRATDVASVVCFSLGLLTKSMVITLPALMAVYEWPIQSLRPSRWRRHGPFWLVSFLYLMVISGNRFLIDSIGRSPRSLSEQVLTQIKAIIYYAKLIFMPVGLNVEHQFFVAEKVSQLVVIAGAIFILSIVVICLRMSRCPVRRVLFLWPIVTLFPVVIVPLNVLVNEHRLYLPLVGLCILVGTWLAGRRCWSAAIVFVVLAALTVQRNAVWEDELSLWKDSVERSPNMPRAHVHLANALRTSGDVDGAMSAYQEALELHPHHRAARTNLATLFYEEGLRRSASSSEGALLLEKAAANYKAVLAFDPDYPEALINFANTQRLLGRRATAESIYLRATARYPNSAEAHYNLAQLLMEDGRPVAAVPLYKKASELQPWDAEVVFQLGNAHAVNDNFDAADSAYSEASRLAPEVVSYRYNLGEVLLAAGERYWSKEDSTAAKASWMRAISVYEGVLRLHADYRSALTRIAQLRAKMGEGG